MEEQIQELVAQIKKIKSESGPNRYPVSLKRELVALWQNSHERMNLLKRLGIGHSTMAFWARASAPPVRLPEPAFKTLSVSVAAAALPRLILPNGITVENLSEEFLLKVLVHAFSAR